MRISGWSSDVCSSDLFAITEIQTRTDHGAKSIHRMGIADLPEIGTEDRPIERSSLDERIERFRIVEFELGSFDEHADRMLDISAHVDDLGAYEIGRAQV